MKATIKVKKVVEIKTLRVDAGVRYWEDASVNGVEDTNGDLIPCKDGDRWKPMIDIESGIITNWKKGVAAEIHYKVCDDGKYYLLGRTGEVILSVDGYVPSIMCPNDNGYGDYIIMSVDENGKIENWSSEPDIEDFMDDNED